MTPGRSRAIGGSPVAKLHVIVLRSEWHVVSTLGVAFNRRVDERHSKMVCSHRGVGSWYKNKRGRVFATSPWRLLDYWNMTAKLDPAEYRFVADRRSDRA